MPCSAARATWYGEGVESGADIMMMDLRWPWWPSGTYYANWNSGIKPQGGISFYAGFLGGLPDGPGCMPNPDEKLQDAFRPGSVWSFWGGDKDGNPVRFVDVAPNLCFKNAYGGEGCNASLHSEAWDFIQCKRWYTMVGRLWQPTDPKANHSFIGRWIKDVENNRWHLIGIEYAAKPDLRPQRLKGEPIPGDRNNLVRMKQPDQPTLDKPEVKNVKAECTGTQVAVSWEIPETSSPAFAHKIEVFDNPACTGAPIHCRLWRVPARHQERPLHRAGAGPSQSRADFGQPVVGIQLGMEEHPGQRARRRPGRRDGRVPCRREMVVRLHGWLVLFSRWWQTPDQGPRCLGQAVNVWRRPADS